MIDGTRPLQRHLSAITGITRVVTSCYLVQLQLEARTYSATRPAGAAEARAPGGAAAQRSLAAQ